MPAGPQRRTPPQERHAYGLTILQPSHPEVRRLQQDAPRPTLHGHKVWPTSFVLLDYLHQRGIAPQTRVLERSEEHTSELQSQSNLVCRLLLEKKKNKSSVT